MCASFSTVCPEYPECEWLQVRPGDSVLLLAQRAGISPGMLIALNPYIDPSELIEGMMILVPRPSPILHVNYGETVVDLSRRMNVSSSALLLLNPQFQLRPPLPGERCHLPRL